ncbi:hypothetical protein TCEL_02371 [Thermobrachium celere DSM 8682]|uniref:Uncharacterized protein n=1 Tax=Thermobrachium celere DSM 8682 TaxID=941824 RepID=R7RTC5_9CLOT|nr:hypothetical protein TCEL_02371 [Thermobrachium celere DSM 8682]
MSKNKGIQRMPLFLVIYIYLLDIVLFIMYYSYIENLQKRRKT